MEKKQEVFPITWHRLDFSGEIVAKKNRGNSIMRGSNPANLNWLNTLLANDGSEMCAQMSEINKSVVQLFGFKGVGHSGVVARDLHKR